MKNVLRLTVMVAIVILALWGSTPAAARIPYNCQPNYPVCGTPCTSPGTYLCCCASDRACWCTCENGSYNCPPI
jgi:hypothetical protein